MGLLASAAAELRNSRRLQLGLVAAGAILALYSLLVWRDAIDRSERKLAAVYRDLRLAHSSEAADRRWREQAARASELLAGLQARLWEAPTLAQAQAQMQDWATKIVQNAGAMTVNVSVGNLPAEPEGGAAIDLRPVRLSIAFDGPPQMLDQILPLLENERRLTRITSLRATPSQQRIEISMLAYARIGTAERRGLSEPGPR
jgi:hypothetical protein